MKEVNKFLCLLSVGRITWTKDGVIAQTNENGELSSIEDNSITIAISLLHCVGSLDESVLPFSAKSDIIALIDLLNEFGGPEVNAGRESTPRAHEIAKGTIEALHKKLLPKIGTTQILCRKHILGGELGLQLRGIIDRILHSTDMDKGLEKNLVAFYIDAKDVLIPVLKDQIMLAGNLLTSTDSTDQNDSSTPGEKALGVAMLAELCDSAAGLIDVLKHESPDFLIKCTLKQLSRDLRLTVIGLSSGESVSEASVQSQHKDYILALLNRIVSVSSAISRMKILSAPSSELMNKYLKTFSDISVMILEECKEHLQAIQNLPMVDPMQLHGVLAASFIGKTVPMVVYSLHATMLDLKESSDPSKGSEILPEVLMSINSAFTEIGQYFRSAEEWFGISPDEGDLLEGRSLSRQLSTYTDVDPADSDMGGIPIIDSSANLYGIEVSSDGLSFSAREGMVTHQGTVALFDYDPVRGAEPTGNYFEIVVDMKVYIYIYVCILVCTCVCVYLSAYKFVGDCCVCRLHT